LNLCIASALAADAPMPDVPQPGTDKQWLGKHNYLASLVAQASRKPPLDIYFLGDSITEFWPELGKDVWRAEFARMRVLNCGVSGDTTQNMLYRITHGGFERIAPRVVIVLAGTNNLSLSPELAPDDLARGVRRIIATLRTKSPSSKILLLSILPSGDASKPLRARIRETNKRLAALGDGDSVFYLDVFSAFLDSDGRFLPGVSPDGTHLTAKGYQVWADSMRPTLQKLLQKTSE
jgi:beta-glucosidase